MAVDYTWTFPQFDVVPSEDGLTNVVKTIHWRYDAQDGEYSAGAYGTVGLGNPNPADFIPYDQITKEWAINAASSSLDMDKLNAALDQQIANQKTPPVVPMAPPF